MFMCIASLPAKLMGTQPTLCSPPIQTTTTPNPNIQQNTAPDPDSRHNNNLNTKHRTGLNKQLNECIYMEREREREIPKV